MEDLRARPANGQTRLIAISSALTVLLLTLSLPSTTSAEPGDLDTSFGGDGKVVTDLGQPNDVINDIAVQPDGKLVAAGYSAEDFSSAYPRPSSLAVARYKRNGRLDRAFAGDGTVTTVIGGSAVAKAVDVQPDGKIVVAGWTLNGPLGPTIDGLDFLLARFNADGSLDASFGDGGVVSRDLATEQFGSATSDFADDVLVQPDGRIVAAASFGLVLRFLPDGRPDSSFSDDGLEEGPRDASLALRPDGRLLVAGQLSGADLALVQYLPDGSLDPAFSGDGVSLTSRPLSELSATDVALRPEGQILVVGRRSSATPFYRPLAASYDASGNLDTSFSGDGLKTGPDAGEGLSRPVLGPPTRRLLFGISFIDAGTFSLLRYGPKGLPDSSFGKNGIVTTPFRKRYAVARATAWPSKRTVYVAGFAWNNGLADFTLARYELGS